MRNIEKEIEQALAKVEDLDGASLARLRELAYLIRGVRPVMTTLDEYKGYWSEYMALRKELLNE